jgi:hypothetical protein
LSSGAAASDVARLGPAPIAEPPPEKTLPAPARLPDEPQKKPAPRFGRASRLVLTAALALPLLGALYWVQRDPTRVAADSSTTLTTAGPATSSPTVSPPQSPPKQAIGIGATTVRTLVWAPVAGATGYEMQLFRGSQRVFVTRTKRPRLTLPERWRYEGRVIRLVPGRYRWNVWPLRAGGARGNTAIVRAQILIAPR